MPKKLKEILTVTEFSIEQKAEQVKHRKLVWNKKQRYKFKVVAENRELKGVDEVLELDIENKHITEQAC